MGRYEAITDVSVSKFSEIDPARIPRETPADLLTLPEAAEHLRISRATMYGLRYKGLAPRSTSAGGRILFRRKDIEAYLDERTIEPASASA